MLRIHSVIGRTRESYAALFLRLKLYRLQPQPHGDTTPVTLILPVSSTFLRMGPVLAPEYVAIGTDKKPAVHPISWFVTPIRNV